MMSAAASVSPTAIEYLWDGVHLVPALIGLFAVAEMINLYVKGGSVANNAASVKITKMSSGLMETFRIGRPCCEDR